MIDSLWEARYKSLLATLVERAEHWEADAREADLAGKSFRGHDNEAAVDLYRQAGRSRSRALELRSIVEAEE
jgi:hypothetical protein